MNLRQEAYFLVSNAGQKLSRDYVANGHVKTVAGFVLKCFGDHEICPSPETLVKAKEMITANNRKRIYSDEELLLAKACLEYKKYKNIKISA